MAETAIPGNVGSLGGVANFGTAKGTTGTSEAGGSFADMVKQVATSAVDSSRAADQASVQSVQGTISDLELTRVMQEAQLSLEKFTTAFEAMKQSLDKVLNTQI